MSEYYFRPEPAFKEVFSKDPAEVISSMNDGNDDIPEQNPSYPMILSSVGVQRPNIPIRVKNPITKKEDIVTADLEILTYIPADKRGIHMSRIGDTIAKAQGRKFSTLAQYAQVIAQAIRTSQYGGKTSVNVTSQVSYIESLKGWKPEKDKLSLERVKWIAGATSDVDTLVLQEGMGVAHITACPCVQQTVRHAVKGVLGDHPILTHSQRSETHIELIGITDDFPFVALLQAIDRNLHRTRNTLPREYEAKLVYLAHQQSQFIEDVVRAVARGIALELDETFNDCNLRIRSKSIESIHDYDIQAEDTYKVRDLKKLL